MSVDSILATGRARRQLLMRDTVTITRVTGQVFSETSGTYLDTTTTVYTGPADVKPRDLQARDVQGAERQVVLSAFDVALPFSTPATFAIGDRLHVDAADDAALTGRTLVVTAVAYGGRRTAHHLTADDQA